MPDPRSRHYFGVFIIGAILALGALAPIFIDYVRGQVAGTNDVYVLAPNATQLHYRFRNDDGGEQAAVLVWATSTDPSGGGNDWASGIAMDSSSIYVVGTQGDTTPRIEKRNASSGALIYATTSASEYYSDIAIDGAYMYLAGRSGGVNWLIEKRNLSSGTLIFATTSNPGVTDEAIDIAIDSAYMYVAGYQDQASANMRVEKRNLSDGSLVYATTSNPGTVDVWRAVAIDGTYMYLGGIESAVNWYIEKRNLSDGSLVYATSSNPGSTDYIYDIAIDSPFMYVVGSMTGSDENWYIQKRNLSDGALVYATTSDSGGTDRATAIVIDKTYMYVSGYTGADLSVIQKRKLSDGSLVYTTSSDPTGGLDGLFSLVTDGKNLYGAGDQNNSGDWRLESRTLGHDTSTATFAASEDNPLLNLGVGTLTRLRMMVSNAGDVVATSSLYRLEYATSTSGPWTRVGSPASTSAHWIMGASAYVSDEQGTHNISGLTDPTSTVTAWSSGQFKSTSSQATLTSTLNSSQFTEYEYAIKGTGSSTLGIPYYFRLTNNGSSLTTYSTYASATLATAGITVSAIAINNGSPIILTPNTTTTVNVNWTVSGGQGCGNVFFSGGNVTSTLYRSGVSSTCSNTPTQSTLNCYYVATTTHNCASATSSASANATTTFGVWYFAESTLNTSTATSSYPTHTWGAFVGIRNGSGTTSTAVAASDVELEALLAITLDTSTFNYGTIVAGQNTSGTNQTTNVKNAGNATTTLQVSGNAMSNGSYAMPTSSQHYATSTFTYGVGDTALTDAATAIGGWLAQAVPLGQWATTTAYANAVGTVPALVNNGYMYVIGGYNGTSYTSTVRYAPINATGSIGAWATTTPYPDAIGYTQGMVVNNGYVYVIGGYNGTSYTSTVRYAPINATGSIGTWATTTPYPNVIGRQPVVVNNGFMYVIAGYVSGEVTTVRYSAINSSTGGLSNWSSTTSFPVTIARHPALVNNGFVYVVAGDIGSGVTTIVRYAQFNATGSLGSWATSTAYPSQIANHSAFVSNDMIYAVGGTDDTNYTSTVRYAPINATGSIGNWSTATAYPNTIGFDPTAVHNGYLYVIGGIGNGSFTSTVRYAPLPTKNLSWGLGVPATSTPGAYTSTVTFTAVYSP